MSDDLVDRLRSEAAFAAPFRSIQLTQAADAIAALQARVAELEAGDAEATRLFVGSQKRMREYKARAEAAEAKVKALVEALRGLVPILCENVEDGCGKLSRHDCAACDGYAALSALERK